MTTTRDIEITRKNAYTAVIKGLLSRKDLGRGETVLLKKTELPIALRLNKFIDCTVIVDDHSYPVMAGDPTYLKNLYNDDFIADLIWENPEDYMECAQCKFENNDELVEDEEEHANIISLPLLNNNSDDTEKVSEFQMEEKCDVSDEINNTGFEPTIDSTTDSDRLFEDIEEDSGDGEEDSEKENLPIENESKPQNTFNPAQQYHYKKKKKK